MNGFSRGSIGELEKKLAEATERAEQNTQLMRKLTDENAAARALLKDIFEHSRPPFLEGKWANYINELALAGLDWRQPEESRREASVSEPKTDISPGTYQSAQDFDMTYRGEHCEHGHQPLNCTVCRESSND